MFGGDEGTAPAEGDLEEVKQWYLLHAVYVMVSFMVYDLGVSCVFKLIHVLLYHLSIQNVMLNYFHALYVAHSVSACSVLPLERVALIAS